MTVRVVIDTNVLIAALTRPAGSSAGLLQAWRDGKIEVIASDATLREAELVLSGAWLERLSSRDDVARLLHELRERSVRVPDGTLPDLTLRDEGDRRLVEAAVAGDAGYLVTADREVLLQRGYRGTQFVTAAELLDALPL